MSDEDICGYETAGDGSPCQNPPQEDGWCWLPGHGESDDDESTDESDAPQVGRPTKLTHQRQEQIAVALEGGVGFKAACEAAGITKQTGHRWLNKGEEQDEGIFCDFYTRITRARGHGKQELSQSIVEMAKENNDPRTLLKYLQHVEGGELSQEGDEELAGLNLVVPEVAVPDDE